MNAPGYESIRERLLLHKPLPVIRDGSAAPDFLQTLVDHCMQRKPLTLLECGSGMTTLALARCCQMNNFGHAWSLEHDEPNVSNTRALLDEFRLGQFASVLYAPLDRISIRGVDYHWYSRFRLDAAPVELLVIDGPPARSQKHARYPALPRLFDSLADGCTVFLDDAARDDEREVVAMWLEQYPSSEHEYLDLERGGSKIVIHKDA